MQRNRNWVLLLLLALSLNILHGFFTQHQHTHHASIQHDDRGINTPDTLHNNCNECHYFHLNFTVETAKIKLPQLAILKPKFEQLPPTILSTINTLYKPPIA